MHEGECVQVGQLPASCQLPATFQTHLALTHLALIEQRVMVTLC
jgi:hypothetical protein